MSASASLRVHFVREGHIECEHEISAVLVDSDGRVLERIGRECVTTWRSGAKPLQLLESLKHIPAEITDHLTPVQLAIGAASHSAEPIHTSLVQQLLGHFSLTTEALYCGVHPPMHKPSELALAREGLSPTVLDSNCSGKHTFMAAAAKHAGWEGDYRPPTHPLQVAMRKTVNEITGNGVHATVTDGCGVPCFVLELQKMATGYARLGAAMIEQPQSTFGRIAAAMASWPEYVSGTDRSDLALVRAVEEPVISKVGAEGLLCVVFPRRKQAFAMKVRSGHEDARMAATRALIERWFASTVSAAAWDPFCTIRSVAGKIVGERIGVWS